MGAVLLVVLALAATSCGSGGDGDRTGAAGSGDDSVSPRPSTPTGSPTPTTSPEGCDLPALRLEREATVPLLYARADETTVPGVRFTLLTPTPGGDRVLLEVSRTAEGCTGTARVTLTPDEPATVLGLRVTSSSARGVDPVPNRASVVLTVTGESS